MDRIFIKKRAVGYMGGMEWKRINNKKDAGSTEPVIHLAWICKMTSESNKYAFSTLSEVVIRDLQVVIRDLQVVMRDLQRKMFGL
jgi:hypothetical protein